MGADEVPVRDREEVPDVLDRAGVVGGVSAADAEAEGDGPEYVPARGAGRLGRSLGGPIGPRAHRIRHGPAGVAEAPTAPAWSERHRSLDVSRSRRSTSARSRWSPQPASRPKSSKRVPTTSTRSHATVPPSRSWIALPEADGPRAALGGTGDAACGDVQDEVARGHLLDVVVEPPDVVGAAARLSAGVIEGDAEDAGILDDDGVRVIGLLLVGQQVEGEDGPAGAVPDAEVGHEHRVGFGRGDVREEVCMVGRLRAGVGHPSTVGSAGFVEPGAS